MMPSNQTTVTLPSNKSNVNQLTRLANNNPHQAQLHAEEIALQPRAVRATGTLDILELPTTIRYKIYKHLGPMEFKQLSQMSRMLRAETNIYISSKFGFHPPAIGNMIQSMQAQQINRITTPT